MSKQILAFALIAALAPQGEEFKPEAVNEGVWLTEAHLSGIEAALAENVNVVNSLTEQRDSHALQAQQATAELATATEKATTQAARITELENEVAALNKKPAAEFSGTSKDQDEPPVGAGANAYNDPFEAVAKEAMGLPE